MEAKKLVRRTERGHYYTPARGTIGNCVAPQGSPSRKGSYSVSPRQKHCLPSNSPRNLLSELVSGLKCIPCMGARAQMREIPGKKDRISGKTSNEH